MADRRAPSPTDAERRAGWLRTAVLVLVAAVGLWFCVRATILRLWEREYPLIGQGFSPPSPVSLALISLNRASVNDGRADPLARQLLEQALRRAPLLSDPFIVAGLDASARDDLVRAQRLMEEARRRDPRAIIPRYWLFDTYLRNGDYRRGVAEAGPLIRVQPAAEPAAVAVLTALLQMPEARPSLRAALAGRPVWRRTFFAQAAASPRLRDQAVAMLAETGLAETGGGGSGRDQQAVVGGLVRAGRYADAYALWLRTLPPGDRPAAPRLFNGGFAGPAGTPPFGWRLRRTARAVPAGDARSGAGLAIQAGDERAVVADQLVLATPGPVRLAFATRALEGDETNAAGMRVELRCHATGRVLAGVTVDAFGPSLRTQSLDATMPADCLALLVRVSVVPGTDPGPLHALLTDLSLSGSRNR